MGRVVKVDPQVVFRKLDDRMLLVHLGTNQIFDLNETSARLWELLAADGDVELAERQLGQEYRVDPGRLREEIVAVLAQLRAEELISDSAHG